MKTLVQENLVVYATGGEGGGWSVVERNAVGGGRGETGCRGWRLRQDKQY